MEGEQIRRELVECQVKTNKLRSQRDNLVFEVIPEKNYQRKVASFALKELEQLPKSSTVYASVGRAYLKSTMEREVGKFKSVESTTDKDLELCLSSKAELEKLITENETRQRNLINLVTKDRK